MSTKTALLKGTFILTATGFLSRFIGFFYRMFLSHEFGAEGVGLYQLVFPVLAFCISLTSSGIQTAISKTVSEKNSHSTNGTAEDILFSGMALTLIPSFILTYVLQRNAHTIAVYLLGDVRCTSLIVLSSYILPFSSIHSCICGYYYGKKQASPPAMSQLFEQFVRVLSVYIICIICQKKQISYDISIAIAGLVIGEIASAFFCIHSLKSKPHRIRTWKTYWKILLPFSLPLTGNRVLINLLQGMEAISIPKQLMQFGLSTSSALSTYGVLTGMALPCILFPSAITSSISIMLLPTVAEIRATGHSETLQTLIRRIAGSCLLMGGICTLFFTVGGNFLGRVLFSSSLAGNFLSTLGWMCPFLYTNATLLSVINGLGNSGRTFLINTSSLLIRIASVFFLIPHFGIIGYLWGLLASQILVTMLCIWHLKKSFI